MRKLFIALALIFAFCTSSASAKVYTTEKTEGFADFIYVAGKSDMYPIEFYDKDKEAFCGIIPDMLRIISEKSGIDFVYINGSNTDKDKMGENLQVEIVSCSANDNSLPYYKAYVELISFENGEKTEKLGFIFTELAEDEVIAKINAAVSEITHAEKNGIYLLYASEGKKASFIWIAILIAVVLMLAAATVILILKNRHLRKEHIADKMTDSETGMGNLQFFKYHFKYTVSDISRSLYYIAYIILDSSYLRSYHGDNSFDEVLKYTASVLSKYTGDREISARITENGFAFAYQAPNKDEAEKRLTELMNKLNDFEDMKEKNNKLVFHSAVYHLGSSDKNCEILLFNLRKNCNKIFGTETQIVFCDTHSMNVIQEEKEITESILKGFEKNEFKMYLQFIVDNRSKKIVSAEALSRWDSKEKDLLGPGKYIASMEMAGLISKHDFYMFELACRQLEKWKNTSFGNIALSCNFTRITLSEETFIDKIEMISNSYDFDKSMLAIEITEDAIEKDKETATGNVTKCKELGFRVYLDDLGSGYTSLANLCDYPIDTVKIDRDILLKAENDKGKDLFTGIVALAHSLNINVICEGVETEEQNSLVSSSACDFVQGRFYSKVLPLEECESFIDLYEKKQFSC